MMYVLVDLIWKDVKVEYDLDFAPWHDFYWSEKEFYVLENLATGELREVERKQYQRMQEEGLIYNVEVG